jgi:hypothetical protein
VNLKFLLERPRKLFAFETQKYGNFERESQEFRFGPILGAARSTQAISGKSTIYLDAMQRAKT